MKTPMSGAPSGAVAGLSDILLALGDELRKANQQVGEYPPARRGEKPEPILFLGGASVELTVTATVSGTGGIKIWVVSTEGSAEYERVGKVTVHLNTGGEPLGVGM